MFRFPRNWMMVLKTVKKKMKELSWMPKKYLGQHLLINELIINQIILSIKNLNPGYIIEVGPGLGALTHHLIPLKIPISIIEKDPYLCQYWRDQKNDCIKHILEGDILHAPWSQSLPDNSVLIGNLPYQIASRLMVQCCPGPPSVQNMVLMFQKEVADRIISSPFTKSYGLLSVLSQCFWDIKVLAYASVNDFYPKPKVAGQVLFFQRKSISSFNYSSFLNFVKMCFEQRRKMLINRLKQRQGDIILDIYKNMDLPASLRAEELSPHQFLHFFQQLQSLKNRNEAKNQ